MAASRGRQSSMLVKICRSFPWVNIIAWILIVAGYTITFIYMTEVIRIYKRFAIFDIIDHVPMILIIVGFVFGFLVLFLSAFSTGYARKAACKKKNINSCGRALTAIAIVLLWLLFLVILFLFAGTLLDTCLIFLISESCYTFKTFTPTSCVSLNDTKAMEKVMHHVNKVISGSFVMTICGNELKTICNEIPETFNASLLTILGCFIVLVGYVLALQAAAANYLHIKYQSTKKTYTLQDDLYDVPFHVRQRNGAEGLKGTYFQTHDKNESEVYF